APELDLVVGEVALEGMGRLEIQQVVAALLEDNDTPARRRQDVCGGGAPGSAPDDDSVGVQVAPAHGCDTSASVQPLGWTSPSNPIDRHPARSRLPPYSGGPYIASQACS